MKATRHVVHLVLLGALATLALSCKVKGERQAYAQLGADAAALRAAFNAEVGKVRLVVLVAPT